MREAINVGNLFLTFSLKWISELSTKLIQHDPSVSQVPFLNAILEKAQRYIPTPEITGSTNA
jgi:hypothetical protein